MEGSVKSLIEAEQRAREIVDYAVNEMSKQGQNADATAKGEL